MGNYCKWTPTVQKRQGKEIVEKESKLYADILDVVKDRNTAVKMWAYTKTADFKDKYDNDVELDELGEVTFPSFLKVLGLENIYEEQRNAEQTAKDYGFTGKKFTAGEAIQKINNFNSKEKKFAAVLEESDGKYIINVVPRSYYNLEEARQQSYNYVLTGEIISLLRTMGFDVSWVNDPKFEGVFDPRNATLHDGLLQVIKIAKGELGEQALPEEFSHLIIEGMINTPLVQRLLSNITFEHIKEVLGEAYDKYYTEYNGDMVKLKKEVAGRLLAEHIKKEGTLSPGASRSNKSLLSRIWNYIKDLLSKITNKQIELARVRAMDAVSDIYDSITSNDVVDLVDKSVVLEGDTLYRLSSGHRTIEEIANEAESKQAKRYVLELERGNRAAANATGEVVRKMQEYNEKDDYYNSVRSFLIDCGKYLEKIRNDIAILRQNDSLQSMSTIQEINSVAKTARDIATITEGYSEILIALSSYDQEVNDILGISSDAADSLAKEAKKCRDLMDKLIEWKVKTSHNILYRAFMTTGFKDNTAVGIRNMRTQIMSIEEILKHADKDINVLDRLFSSMSDSTDAFLVLVDSVVRNQLEERDWELREVRQQIAVLDENLRKAGFSSDFMYERDENGVPTGRIISEYDWDTYLKEFAAEKKRLRELGYKGEKYYKAIQEWRNHSKNGHSRLIPLFVDPLVEDRYKAEEKIDLDKEVIEWAPNPKYYTSKPNPLEGLSDAQRDYYNKMMRIKRTMMSKVPHRGQSGIYRAVYISKDFIEGVLDGSSGSILKATKDYYEKKFTRRPDDLGFGISSDFNETVLKILDSEKDAKEAAIKILNALEADIDEDIRTSLQPSTLQTIIEKSRQYADKVETTVEKVMARIEKENYYIVKTDFADHEIQRVPVYFTRPLSDMRSLSTDFSGTLTAYSAMALNYSKLNEVVDIVELARDYNKHTRTLKKKEGEATVWQRYRAFEHVYKAFIERAGSGTNIDERLDRYIDAVVYDQQKKNEGTVKVFGVNLDIAKSVDAIRDYTGLLGLGFNIFSAFSNITVGKLQMWIEAYSADHFDFKDYMKACTQYAEEIWGCMAEMGSPIKKNKLSLLIQMFDPMGENYEDARSSNMVKGRLKRILGNGVLAYLGMNAGEHLLRCQTMLAMLNHIKLIDTKNNNNKISLYDALVPETDKSGVTRLKLKEGLEYERPVIDYDLNPKNNPNYGKQRVDKDGKKIYERIKLEGDNIRKFIIRRKRAIRKVNNTLNGAFNYTDKGTVHHRCLMRMAMQFRQWMPGHYERRFAAPYYDDDLERWREGYYRTVGKLWRDTAKDLVKYKWNYMKYRNQLSEEEHANLRRAQAEILMFASLMLLCRWGGKVSDRDRSWLNKMVLYQIHRMYLEVGASVPSLPMISNILQIMQSPAPSISFVEKVRNIMKVYNMFDEISTGRYQGWSEWERDLFKLTPIDQILKAIEFDDSMFAMYEEDD